MQTVKNVTVAGDSCTVTISDDEQALQAAYAAGGAVIGIWDGKSAGRDFPGCLYLVTDPEEADGEMLKRAVLRRKELPWRIGETKRLLIREFKKDDPLETPEDRAGTDDLTFSQADLRDAYIDSQYRFCECGLWAVVERKSGRIAGKAGITGNELGYHIYPAFRRQGYALEACRAILAYAEESMALPAVFLKADEGNAASLALASRLGFTRISQEGHTLIFEKKER